MTAWRRRCVAWAALGVGLALAGCGGIRVDGTTWRPASVPVFAVDVGTATLSPTHDQLVTTCMECDLSRVDSLDYLVAGADEAGREWQAWLRFDLTVLGEVDAIGRATLVLPSVAGPSLPGGVDRATFVVRPVADPWDGTPLRRERAPRLSDRAVATIDVTELPAGEPWRVDVTEAVVVALQAGRPTVTLAIVPEATEIDFRWRLASTEAGGLDDERATPQLRIEPGPAPRPTPAARR